MKNFIEKPQGLKTKEEVVNKAFCFIAVSKANKVMEFLASHYEFRNNIANNVTEFKKVGEAEFRDMTEIDLNSIWLNMSRDQEKGVDVGVDTLQKIIKSDAFPSYDPYRSFLESLPEWNGRDHIMDLASTVKTDDDEFWQWSLKKWFVALVGSLADDKTVNQTALIMCGGQGAGKSSWFRHLLPKELRRYYASGFMDFKDKETLVQLSELVLFNMDELVSLDGKNVQPVKELITKPDMRLRRAYTKLTQNYIRRCSFCGTSNTTDILYDVTGNRRFLCNKVINITDYELKGFNLPQLYAQAYQLFRTGFKFWLDVADQNKVEEHNARFRSVPLEEEIISTYLEPCKDGEDGAKRMQTHEILDFLQDKLSRNNKLSLEKLGKTLSAMGFLTKKSGLNYRLVRVKSILADTEQESNPIHPSPSEE